MVSYALDETLSFSDANYLAEKAFQQYFPPIVFDAERKINLRTIQLNALNQKPLDFGMWPLVIGMMVVIITFAKLRPENFTEEEIQKNWEKIEEAVKKEE